MFRVLSRPAPTEKFLGNIAGNIPRIPIMSRDKNAFLPLKNPIAFLHIPPLPNARKPIAAVNPVQVIPVGLPEVPLFPVLLQNDNKPLPKPTVLLPLITDNLQEVHFVGTANPRTRLQVQPTGLAIPVPGATTQDIARVILESLFVPIYIICEALILAQLTAIIPKGIIIFPEHALLTVTPNIPLPSIPPILFATAKSPTVVPLAAERVPPPTLIIIQSVNIPSAAALAVIVLVPEVVPTANLPLLIIGQ